MKTLCLTIASLAFCGFAQANTHHKTTTTTVTHPAAREALVTESLPEQFDADSASQLVFEPGQSGLTSAEIDSLRDMVANARANGEKIDEVKVFVWGDNAYPLSAGVTATGADKKIADERATSIKKYLQKELNVADVSTYNLARRPTYIQEQLKQLGKTDPRTDASGTTQDQILGVDRSSEALVLLYK